MVGSPKVGPLWLGCSADRAVVGVLLGFFVGGLLNRHAGRPGGGEGVDSWWLVAERDRPLAVSAVSAVSAVTGSVGVGKSGNG